MQGSQILWIDQRYSKYTTCISHQLVNDYRIQHISDAAEIDDAVQHHQPKLLCFDYDYPDQMSLETLKNSKSKYPALPFIMLTKDDSTELVNWALRLRAWDYFIKPVVTDKLINSIDILLEKCLQETRGQRNNHRPQPVVPYGPRSYKNKANGASTALAISYIKKHLENKISLEKVASLCGMSKSNFSRTFKLHHNITFQEFICQQRLNRAVELLKKSDLMVTQIAFSVGFTELSNFTRKFQKYIGLGPSDFRKALIPQ